MLKRSFFQKWELSDSKRTCLTPRRQFYLRRSEEGFTNRVLHSQFSAFRVYIPLHSSSSLLVPLHSSSNWPTRKIIDSPSRGYQKLNSWQPLHWIRKFLQPLLRHWLLKYSLNLLPTVSLLICSRQPSGSNTGIVLFTRRELPKKDYLRGYVGSSPGYPQGILVTSRNWVTAWFELRIHS